MCFAFINKIFDYFSTKKKETKSHVERKEKIGFSLNFICHENKHVIIA